jgi:mannose-1-phosphate guanylyltransferase
MSNLKSVIMAGGIGARFWPLSRRDNPKQFLSLTGNLSLIEETMNRIRRFSAPEDIYIVTNQKYMDRLQGMFSDIPASNVIYEPLQRNTAPCIGLAAAVIQKRSPGSVMAVFPADHLIGNDKAFTSCIVDAAQIAAERDVLVTIGVEPDRPETGYGYIQTAGEISPGCRRVRTFAEKPNLATAQRFLESGDFLWNAGIFIWRTDFFLENLHKYLEEVYEVIEEIQEAVDTPGFNSVLQQAFHRSPSVSVDHGILEKSPQVAVIHADFPWSDVGTWQEAYLRSEKDEHDNVIKGEVITVDSSGSYVQGYKRLIAMVGVKDLVVIDTGDAILVADRSKIQNVGKIVELLRDEERNEYL